MILAALLRAPKTLNPRGMFHWLVLEDRQDTPQLAMGTAVSCENLLYPSVPGLISPKASNLLRPLLGRGPAGCAASSQRVCVRTAWHGICSSTARQSVLKDFDVLVNCCAALGSRVGSGDAFYRADTCEWILETGDVCMSVCLLE